LKFAVGQKVVTVFREFGHHITSFEVTRPMALWLLQPKAAILGLSLMVQKNEERPRKTYECSQCCLKVQ
jgi:hypothetical protein